MGKVIKCKFWCNAGHTEEEEELKRRWVVTQGNVINA